MPMQALPFLKSKKIVSTITIHDLAFKIFPQFFPKKDLRRLNLFTDFAIKHSDKIIAISQSTKNDILKFYPQIKEEKIKVIHHGFDPDLFQKKISNINMNNVLNRYGLQATGYVLYVGALQPRKNLEVLIEAFEKVKKDNPNLKLVLAGEKAWMWKGIMNKVENSQYGKDVIITGTVSFSDIISLYQGASLFVFPSLYEGFGLPILEAMASGVPVISANNSSLQEIGGTAAEYFESSNSQDLAEKINSVLNDESKRQQMVVKGMEQIKKFSWDKCAGETLEYIKL
jgi:glycosyltransferase involved in cell wall biosynthesis